MRDKYGTTAVENAPASNVSTTLTKRFAYTSAETLPAGSMAAIAWSTSNPPEATTALSSIGPYWCTTSLAASVIPCQRRRKRYPCASIIHATIAA